MIGLTVTGILQTVFVLMSSYSHLKRSKVKSIDYKKIP